MKPVPFCRIAGIPLLIALSGAFQASAQPLTWDSTGVATADPVVAPVDGGGNWLDAGKWWNGTSHVTWDNTTNASTVAVFGTGGTSGDINLGTGVSAGGLRLNGVNGGKGYQFLAGGTLTLGSGSVIDIFNGSSGSAPDNRIRFQNVIAGNNITITNATDAANTAYVVLGGANLWTGKLTLTGNTASNSGLFVNVRNTAALGTLTEIEINPSTTLSLEAAGIVLPNTTTLRLNGAGLGGRGAIRADQSATINSNIILTGATRLGTNATSSVVVTVNGNITGAFALTLGNDTDAMAGRYVFKSTTSTYTTLTVSKGNAQIGEGGVGSTGTGIVTLSGSTAVVSGTGSTKSGFLVANGTIRPGDNGGVDRGTFTVNGNLNFTGMDGLTTSRTAVEFGLSSPSTGTSDRINVTGNLRLHANGQIAVAFEGGYTPVLGDSWTLFRYNGALTLEGNATAGLFSLGTNLRSGANDGTEGSLDLPDLSASGYLWSITSGASNSALVVTVVIPEPAAPAMAAAGTLLLALRRRRR